MTGKLLLMAFWLPKWATLFLTSLKHSSSLSPLRVTSAFLQGLTSLKSTSMRKKPPEQIGASLMEISWKLFRWRLLLPSMLPVWISSTNVLTSMVNRWSISTVQTQITMLRCTLLLTSIISWLLVDLLSWEQTQMLELMTELPHCTWLLLTVLSRLFRWTSLLMCLRQTLTWATHHQVSTP